MIVADTQETTQLLKARSGGRLLASIGLLLMMGPLVLFAITAYGMIQSYGILAGGGSTDPGLGNMIALTMKISMWGLGAAIVGSIFVDIAVVALGNREQWVYRNGLVLAVMMCLTFGVLGIVFGGGLIAILLIRRAEFRTLGDCV
jgi:hypothetical protein